MMNNDKSFYGDLTAFLNSPLKVICFDSIDSTNTEAKRRIKAGETSDLLIAANEQTCGRGRQGKSFYSPKDTGVYFSVVLNAKKLPSFLSLTTAAAVSVSRAIEKHTGKVTQIKWVNDIYLYGKKVCGILCESISAGKNVNAVIIGIGINLTTADFPLSVENGGNIDFKGNSARLVAQIADGIYKTAFVPCSEYIDYYRSRSMLTGKKINIIETDKKTPATALGISDTGALTVLLESGEILNLSTGDVTVREE